MLGWAPDSAPIPMAARSGVQGGRHTASQGLCLGDRIFQLETTSSAETLKGGDLLEIDKDISWKHFRRGRQKGWREGESVSPPVLVPPTL